MNKTKKELIEELVGKGLAEETLKGLTNAKLEALLAEFGDSELDVDATLESQEDVQDTPVTDEEKPADEKEQDVEEAGEVVSEITLQLAIYNKVVYNTKHKGAKLVVENLGYGDVYVSTEDDVRVGDESQRLLFKESKELKADRLYMLAGSQPVVQVLEIK